MVTQDEGDEEEGNSKEYGDAGDQVDEVVDFLSDRGLSSIQAGSQASNSSHHLKTKSILRTIGNLTSDM